MIKIYTAADCDDHVSSATQQQRKWIVGRRGYLLYYD